MNLRVFLDQWLLDLGHLLVLLLILLLLLHLAWVHLVGWETVWLLSISWRTGWHSWSRLLLLLHHLHLSHLHLLHLGWIESVLVHSASQVVSGKQNVNVVGVEDLAQHSLKLLDVHLWRQGKGLDEEH